MLSFCVLGTVLGLWLRVSDLAVALTLKLLSTGSSPESRIHSLRYEHVGTGILEHPEVKSLEYPRP